MKRRIAFLVLALLMIAPALAGGEEQLVTIKPEKPMVGTEITIHYNPLVKGAMLFGAEGVEVQVLVFRGGDVQQLFNDRTKMPILLETPMKKQGKAWEAKIKLEDPQSKFGMIRFAADKVVDTNQDNYWEFLVYDKGGRPVQGAHLDRSLSYLHPGFPSRDFKREKNLSRVREEVQAEESLYPKQWQTKFRLWEIALGEKRGDTTLVRNIAKELDGMTQQFAENDEVLSTISGWYKRLQLAEKAQALQDRLIAKDPKGKFARQTKLQKIYETREAAQMAKRALEFIREFPDAEPGDKSTVIAVLVNAKQFDKAEEILAMLPAPSGNLLNNLAWPYIENDINVARGVELARRGVEALRKPEPNARPLYFPLKQWEQSRRNSLGYVLDTYAFGLFKLGQYQEAQQAYHQAYDLTEGSHPDINERLVECYLKNGDYANAVEVTKACIEKSKYNDKLLEYGKEAFVKKEGNAEGFDKLVAAAKERGIVKAKEKLMAERVDKPALDFSAKNLAGETIQLAQLKGKVVLLDFWATWCGPCKMAFPFVQKVYEQYKNNPDVVILAVNTWENEKGAEREKLVKKFMEDNKYTFPVVYDETGVVEKYKVEGIPTQFFIDRKGAIQFKTVGFEGPEMEQGMALKIDLLLSGELLSTK